MKNNLILKLFLFSALGILFNCTGKKDQRALVDELVLEEVAKRIKTYKDVRKERCFEDMYRVAGEIADSILLQEARNSRDTANKPPIPDKPIKPEIIELKDTTPIKPFLPKDSINAIQDSMN